MSNFIKSSIGKKLVMSITGLFLIVFLLFHMSMNVVAIFSTEAYDMICEFLGANWYAIVATLIMAAGFVFHIVYATILTLGNRKARGDQRYAVAAKPKEVSFASQNMFVLGVIVVGFLVLHLFNFWYKMQFAELMHDPNAITKGAGLVAELFSNPVYVVLYLIWLAALWFHLTHGFWSAFQTIGWNNAIWFSRLRCVANLFATLIFAGFAVVVLYFFMQSLCCGASC